MQLLCGCPCKKYLSANLQYSIGDISGKAFLHVDENHTDANPDGRRNGEDEDGGDGLASAEVGLSNIQS